MKKALPLTLVIVLVAIIGLGVMAGLQYSYTKTDILGAYAEVSAPSAEIERTELSSSSDSYADITFNNINKPDGSVLRSIQVYVDVAKLTSNQKAVDKILIETTIDVALEGIRNTFDKNGYTVSYDRGNDFVDITLQEYESLTDLYLAYGYTGYDVDEDTDTTIKWGAFYNTYNTKMTTIFKDIENTVFANIRDALISTNIIGKQNISYIYNYGTKYPKRTIFSDADNIYYYEKYSVYIHKFEMREDTRNKEITISQNNPNVLTWYGIAILSAGIPATVFIILAKKKKEK